MHFFSHTAFKAPATQHANFSIAEKFEQNKSDIPISKFEKIGRCVDTWSGWTGHWAECQGVSWAAAAAAGSGQRAAGTPAAGGSPGRGGRRAAQGACHQSINGWNHFLPPNLPSTPPPSPFSCSEYDLTSTDLTTDKSTHSPKKLLYKFIFCAPAFLGVSLWFF